MSKIHYIEEQISALRENLRNHELYHHLSDVDDIKVFMEHHVFAVWDFMSLLKALQQRLTCISLPWKPAANAKVARFVNEIVLGEETDLNELGVPKSHFEMYLDAMAEVGASTNEVLQLVQSANTVDEVLEQIQSSGLKPGVKEFLSYTFTIIQSGQTHKIAAAFTFGREDLIPDMFFAIIEHSKHQQNNTFPKLSYYLNRHIELDGDEHGPLSLEMISALCGDDEGKWNDVLEVSIEALEKRINLWDEISTQIKQNKSALHFA